MTASNLLATARVSHSIEYSSGTGGHGQAWDRLEACRDEIQAQVKQGLTVVKIGMLLERQGAAVPYRTLHRFCAERCDYGRSAARTVRVADGEPGG